LFLFLLLPIPAVILSATQKDPGTASTAHTARTFQPENRVPHLRRSFIAPKVGIERSETAFSHPQKINLLQTHQTVL
jgi:hypothetical protein